MIMMALTDEQRAILKALSLMGEPAGCKEIGERAGIPWRTVMARLRGLKAGGYVESPVEGKYSITEKGRKAIS
jgi:Mn-dependent DtxR family transcriptional regulator